MSAYSHNHRRFLIIVLAGLSLTASLVAVQLAQRFPGYDSESRDGFPIGSSQKVSLGTLPGEEKRSAPVTGPVSTKMPAMTLGSFNRKIESLGGTPIVVNFWASWCGPCRTEAADLVRLAGTYKRDGVTFIGINVSDNDGPAAEFIKQYRVKYANYSDTPGKISASYRVTALPTTIVIDPRGAVAGRYVGALDAGNLSNKLNHLLARSASRSPVGRSK